MRLYFQINHTESLCTREWEIHLEPIQVVAEAAQARQLQSNGPIAPVSGDPFSCSPPEHCAFVRVCMFITKCRCECVSGLTWIWAWHACGWVGTYVLCGRGRAKTNILYSVSPRHRRRLCQALRHHRSIDLSLHLRVGVRTRFLFGSAGLATSCSICVRPMKHKAD